MCTVSYVVDCVLFVSGLKKNLNASRPSEHPSARGKMSKLLLVDGIIGC